MNNEKKTPKQSRAIDAMALSIKGAGCVDVTEYQAIAVAWAFSSSVICLRGDKASVASALKCIKPSLAQSHKFAQVDPLAHLDEASLTALLATEWALARGSLDDGIAAVVECIEKREGSSVRYLLLVESAEALSDEVWQLLSTLCKLGNGRIGLLLSDEAPRLNEQCDRFFTSAALPVLCHTLNRGSDGQPAVNPDKNKPLDPSHPPQKKTVPLLRNAYLIIVVILLLALLFFQQAINNWIASPEPTTAEVEFESDPPLIIKPSEESGVVRHDVESERLPKELVEVSQALSSGVVSNIDTASSVEKKPNPEPHAEESLNKLVPVAVEPAVVAETPTPAGLAVANESPKLNTESWILSQPSQAYTLHVMSVRNEQSLRDFIVEKDLADKAAYYQAMRKSGRWFVLLVGHYADIETAEKIVPTIEKKLNVKGIIIRKFEYSQADIKSSKK